MKKLLSILLVLMLAAIPSSSDASVPDVIKLGLMGTISGAQAIDGRNMQDSMTLIMEELEAAGGFEVRGKKVKVEVIVEDTEAKPEIAVNVVQKLIHQDGVLAIIGPNNSSDTLACGEVSQASQIPHIATTATNIRVTLIGDYIFRACFIDPFQGRVVAKFAWEDLGSRKAAVLYNNADAYSVGLYESFREHFESHGGVIVAAEAYPGADVMDYSAQLTIIQNSNPDVIFYPNQISMSPLQLQQTRRMGITVPMLGCDSWDYDLMPDLVGHDIIEGSYYVTGFSPEAESAVDFVDTFNNRFGYRPSFQSAMTYEAFKIVLNAIQNAATIDGPGIRNAMAATDMNLPSGRVVFDENRNPVKSGTILQVLSGRRVYVKSVSFDD